MAALVDSAAVLATTHDDSVIMSNDDIVNSRGQGILHLLPVETCADEVADVDVVELAAKVLKMSQ